MLASSALLFKYTGTMPKFASALMHSHARVHTYAYTWRYIYFPMNVFSITLLLTITLHSLTYQHVSTFKNCAILFSTLIICSNTCLLLNRLNFGYKRERTCIHVHINTYKSSGFLIFLLFVICYI